MRIGGVKITLKKKLRYALTDIPSIGFSRAGYILDRLGIKENQRAENISDEEVEQIENEINQLFDIDNFHRNKNKYKEKLINIKCYRGLRFLKGLPVNGQRTKSNSKTSRKQRIVLGAKKGAPQGKKEIKKGK